MLHAFIPDYVFQNVYLLSPSFFTEKGVRGIIFDIDNTLVTYDDPEPTPELSVWLQQLQDAGIAMAFVSNNNRERVERFNRRLGFFASAKSGKPSRRGIFAAMDAMSTTPASTVAVGDQIFTDVLAAKRAGLRVVLVDPIKDKKTLFFRAKRLLEKPFLRYYHKHREDKQ